MQSHNVPEHEVTFEVKPSSGSGSHCIANSSEPEEFSNPTKAPVKDRFKPSEAYEGFHRWDPVAQWQPQEERRLVRKLDWKVLSRVCFATFAVSLDRGNTSYALADKMLDNIDISRNEFNYGTMVFWISYLIAEFPCAIIAKKVGPDLWIPIQMIVWGIVAACSSPISGSAGWYSTRVLLGCCEAGSIPAFTLYLSYFYTSKELPFRLTFLTSAVWVTNIVGAFIAYGTLRLRQSTGWAGWRWLFALEGCFTLIVGVTTLICLPTSITHRKSRKSWLTEREEIIAVNRLLRDDPGKAQMHSREGLTLPLIWQALKDYHLWPLYLVAFTWSIPIIPFAQYFTLFLGDIGFPLFTTILFTIPAHVLLLIQGPIWTWLSDKMNDRFSCLLATQLWVLPLLIAQEILPASASQWTRYIILMLICGQPFTFPILLAIASNNAGSVSTRAFSTTLVSLLSNASLVISVNLFREDDKPYYKSGTKGLIGVAVFVMVCIIGSKLHYKWVNKRREEKWTAMSDDEREEYMKTSHLEGNRRLDWRFQH